MIQSSNGNALTGSVLQGDRFEHGFRFQRKGENSDRVKISAQKV